MLLWYRFFPFTPSYVCATTMVVCLFVFFGFFSPFLLPVWLCFCSCFVSHVVFWCLLVFHTVFALLIWNQLSSHFAFRNALICIFALYLYCIFGLFTKANKETNPLICTVFMYLFEEILFRYFENSVFVSWVFFFFWTTQYYLFFSERNRFMYLFMTPLRRWFLPCLRVPLLHEILMILMLDSDRPWKNVLQNSIIMLMGPLFPR